jgi:hypothetical protein
MFPHQEHHDKGVVDVMFGEKLHWVRFFASLRMTAGCTLR